MNQGYVIDLSKAAKEMSAAEYSALFHRLERLRSDARHNEAAALGNARREATAEERAKWQGVVADKDAALADKDSEIERLRAQLGKDK
jgi:hypothetical protein